MNTLSEVYDDREEVHLIFNPVYPVHPVNKSFIKKIRLMSDGNNAAGCNRQDEPDPPDFQLGQAAVRHEKECREESESDGEDHAAVYDAAGFAQLAELAEVMLGSHLLSIAAGTGLG